MKTSANLLICTAAALLLASCGTEPAPSPVPTSTSEPAAPEVNRSAEEAYRRALDVARRQGARSLELRAAISLSLLCQAEGRQAEARELLAPVYGRLSEGQETSDLRAGAALLAELGARSATSPT